MEEHPLIHTPTFRLRRPFGHQIVDSPTEESKGEAFHYAGPSGIGTRVQPHRRCKQRMVKPDTRQKASRSSRTRNGKPYLLKLMHGTVASTKRYKAIKVFTILLRWTVPRTSTSTRK